MPERSSSPSNQPNVPAPWTLKGEGIILIYRFKKSWVEENGHLPEPLKGKFHGGFGYVMLVNYKESPVGPYKELLFIPGKFQKNRLQSITRIYVDSESSTQNGRKNWGIPKETLPFTWESKKGSDLIAIKSGTKEVFSAEISYSGFPFPVSTALLPLRLGQTLDKMNFLTKPSGSGWGKLAKIKKLNLVPEFFPDIRLVKPLLAIKVNPFTIHFPKPTFSDEPLF
jgi:hypothetical protein